jgi:FHA domain
VSAVCREGHLSDEPDYCSVCGAPILAGSSGAGAASASAGATPIPVPRSAVPRGAGPATCPSCGEPREDPDGRFCEVCRYDFVERRPGPPPVAKGAATAAPQATPSPEPAKRPSAVFAAPVAPPVPAAPPPAVAPAPVAPAPPRPAAKSGLTPLPFPAASAPVPQAWELVIAVDPALDTDPDAESPCPAGRADIVLPVDKPDMLVGRHDETRAIHPEVSLHDPGASRRHARFVLEPDGGIALQDLASTNGTQVNGQDVGPGTRRRLREGDSVTLGRWTRITVRGKA